jgi:hypothetical protein
VEGKDAGVAVAAAAAEVADPAAADGLREIEAAAMCAFCHQTITFPVQASCCGASFCELCILMHEAAYNNQNPARIVERLRDITYYHICLNCNRAENARTYKKNLTLEAVLATIPVLSAAVTYTSTKIHFRICDEIRALEAKEREKPDGKLFNVTAVNVEHNAGRLDRNICTIITNVATNLFTRLMPIGYAQAYDAIILRAQDAAINACIGEATQNPLLRSIQIASNLVYATDVVQTCPFRTYSRFRQDEDICSVRLFIEFTESVSDRAVQLTLWFNF